MGARPVLSSIVVVCALLISCALVQPAGCSETGSGDFGASGGYSDFFSDIYNSKVARLHGENAPLPAEDTLQRSLTRFDTYLNGIFSQGVAPGMAVAVVYKDRVVYQKCLGVKKNGTSDAVDSDTVFQIGSHSKPFTATAIASLVDDGTLEWDDRIVEYYPEFAMYDPWVGEHMTFRDALVHRSGLPSYAAGELMTPFLYNASEILYRIRYLEPESDFRTKYSYQNVMYLLAGEAAARAAGKEWPDLIEERIFIPLEMNSTSARFHDYITSDNRVWNHEEKNGIFPMVDPYDYDPMAPAGGVSSSINDMVKWVVFQINDGAYKGNQIVSSGLISETHRIQIVESAADDYVNGYGLGWFIVFGKQGMTLHHGGATRSSTSYVLILPEEDIGIVVLCNKGPSPSLAEAICFTFRDLYRKGEPAIDYYDYFKKGQDAWFEGQPVGQLPPAPANATPALAPEAYSGRYSSHYYGVITIEPDGDMLKIYLGHNPVPLNLIHWSGNTFMEETSQIPVTFSTGEGNVTGRVFLSMFDFAGRNGTFVRVQGG
jgi:CubicO group peptidase (beta-lactamase class C family)